MSLDKAIEHGKERRKRYYRRGRVSKGCRPHGFCSYCLSSRTYQEQRVIQNSDDILNDYEDSLKHKRQFIRGIKRMRRIITDY